MKTLLLSLFFSLILQPSAFSGYTPPDSLFAIPDSNLVILWDLHANRNCAAQYRMEVTVEGQQITWIQRDTNGYAYCYCDFDYNVRFGPLSPGEYKADVFFTEAYDSTLNPLGSIRFTILEPITDSLVIFEPFSSKCGGLYLSTRENPASLLGQNYPNPFREFTRIPVQAGSPGPLTVEIFNSFGEMVSRIETSDPPPAEINFSRINGRGYLLPPGIYYYSTNSTRPQPYRRMVIMD